MAIDTHTNVRLVRSWRLLLQSSHNLRCSADRLYSGGRVNSHGDDEGTDEMPNSIRGMWRMRVDPDAHDGMLWLAETCEALDSIEQVLGRLLSLTQGAPDGLVSDESRAALQRELCVIGSSLERIASATPCSDVPIRSGLHSTVVDVGLQSANASPRQVDPPRGAHAQSSFDSIEKPHPDKMHRNVIRLEAGWENVQAAESRPTDVEDVAKVASANPLKSVDEPEDTGLD